MRSAPFIRLLARAKGLESPTPVVVFGGPLFFPSRWRWSGIVTSLASRGFEVYECDLVRPQRSLCTFETPDDVADMLNKEFSVARLCVPPLALSFGMESVLLQKLLESYALAGLVMIDPMPPSIAPALHSLLDGDSMLPKSSSCDKAGPTRAIASRLAHIARSPSAAVVAASFLLKLAASPVNLEPSPVPMLLISSGVNEAPPSLCGVEDTAKAHNLTPIKTKSTLACSPPTLEDESPTRPHHAPSQPVLTDHLMEWITSRF